MTEYASKLDTEEEIRELQDIWLEFDKVSCQENFQKQFEHDPNSAKLWYLALRAQDDADKVLKESIKLCNAHPDYYWGYRLFISSFMAWMLEAGLEEKNSLQDVDLELKTLDKGNKLFPDDDYFSIIQFHRYRITGDYSKAETFLGKIRNLSLLKPHWLYVRYFLIVSQNIATYESLMPKLLLLQREDTSYTQQDSLFDYAQGYVTILEQTKSWKKLESYFATNPILLDNWAFFDHYASMLAATSRWDELLQQLSLSVDKGVTDKERLQEYGIKWQLDKRAEWPALVKKAESQVKKQR